MLNLLLQMSKSEYAVNGVSPIAVNKTLSVLIIAIRSTVYSGLEKDKLDENYN